MNRIPTSAAVLASLLAACASTTTPKNPDADGGDTVSDFPDFSDLPDSGDIPHETPDLVGDPDAPDVPDDRPPDAGGGVVGDACYSASQCGGVPGSGVTCLTSIMGYITFPGGYCSAVCTSAADCGAGGACVTISDLGRYCLKSCTTPSMCRSSEGYTCAAVPGASGTYCIPPFSSPESDS